MSLVTRCPVCGTTFKVAGEQLRISDGWVRCGRCSEVFDGNESLHDANAVASIHGEAPASPPAFDFPDPSTFPGAPAPGGVGPAVSTSGDEEASPTSAGVGPVPAQWLGQWPSLDLNPGVAPVVAAAAVAQAAPPVAAVAPVPTSERTFDVTLASTLSEIAAPPVSMASEFDTPAAHSGFSTLEQRDGPVMRWLRRLPGFDRLPLRTISAGALLLLAAQSIHHSRDAIAAQHPALRSGLEAMCGIGGCRLSAVRRIDAITIDGASFARDAVGDVYRLAFTVRNRATVPLAMPAIEVTLLDTQERAVIRRTLMPADIGAPDVLEADTTRPVMLPLALSGADALPPVVGYGIAAFYP